MISMQLHSLDILLFFLLKGDYQKSNVSFHIFFHNFLNISISTFILCLIYRNFRICNYFLLKINISGAINVSVRLGIKKIYRKMLKFSFSCPFLQAVQKDKFFAPLQAQSRGCPFQGQSDGLATVFTLCNEQQLHFILTQLQLQQSCDY